MLWPSNGKRSTSLSAAPSTTCTPSGTTWSSRSSPGSRNGASGASCAWSISTCAGASPRRTPRENKRVVQVCLERIDACRPFFLCFLGQRRGWVPAGDDISARDLRGLSRAWTRYAGDASVTELEILHALGQSAPPGQGDRGRRHASIRTRRARLLLPAPAGVPGCICRGDVPQLREVYTNEGIADPGTRAAEADVAAWRAGGTVEIPRTGRPVACLHGAAGTPAASTPEIRLPLQCPSTAERGQRGLARQRWRRWSAQWAQAGVRVDEDGEIGDPQSGRRPSASMPGWLRAGWLTSPARASRWRTQSLADLQAAIQARYPEHVEAAVLTPLQRELDQQAQFLQAAGEGFIEREGDFCRAWTATCRTIPASPSS